MNERYLFRGERVDNGKWVQGFIMLYEHRDKKFAQITNDFDDSDEKETAYSMIRVDPSTVGQCTGLRDMKGTLIFEGDVVTWVDSDDCLRTDIVEWNPGGLVLHNRPHYTVGSYSRLDIMVRGNLHDNPHEWRCITCTHGDGTMCNLNRAACGDDYKYWE